MTWHCTKLGWCKFEPLLVTNLSIPTVTTTLIIGFDSAWSGNNSGAIVGVVRQEDASYKYLGNPLIVDFQQATQQINDWQHEHHPATSLILIDQPTIVPNMKGQRPVEGIVGTPVGRRYGGVQPANRGKGDLFGDDAPIWQFLNMHNALLNPAEFARSQPATWVIETYPVLTLIALNWLLADDHPRPRPTRRLPKYNPANRNFSFDDWQFVCNCASNEFEPRGMQQLIAWITAAGNNPLPATSRERKQLQDRLDACLCLLVALYLIEGRNCLMVGNMESGYMVIPHGEPLHNELVARCDRTGRPHHDWVRELEFQWPS